MNKKVFTKDDLLHGTSAQNSVTGDVVTHAHIVEFARPLTEAEQHLFTNVLQGFYYTVRFSRQFGSGLVAAPLVEILDQQTIRYTLRQTSMSGQWKELLLAILANFSLDVAPINKHDESRVFAPKKIAA